MRHTGSLSAKSGPDGSDAYEAGPGSPSSTHSDCPAPRHLGQAGRGASGRTGPPGRGVARAAGSGPGRDAHEEALRLLEARPRTVADMRRRLTRRGHAPDAIDVAIDRLTRAGLLDDDAYAKQFARSRLAAGRVAPSRIRLDLVKRGVASKTASVAVQDVLGEEPVDMAALLDRVVRRRAAALSGLDPQSRSRRLYAYLARRGFDADDVRRALQTLRDHERGRTKSGE